MQELSADSVGKTECRLQVHITPEKEAGSQVTPQEEKEGQSPRKWIWQKHWYWWEEKKTKSLFMRWTCTKLIGSKVQGQYKTVCKFDHTFICKGGKITTAYRVFFTGLNFCRSQYIRVTVVIHGFNFYTTVSAMESCWREHKLEANHNHLCIKFL